MAGDWIKVEHWTPDKPEVFAIAEKLGIDPDAVTGKLIRIWIWADQQGVARDDGSVTFCVTRASLDRLAGVTGFCDALVCVNWVERSEDGTRFINFCRHNGETAKMRALNAKRNRAKRNRDAGRDGKRDASSVTNVTVTASLREEKRREDVSHSKNEIGAQAKTRSRKAPFVKPTLDEIAAYCAERKSIINPQLFFDHYESNGWVVGKSPMKDWRATVRKWESSEFNRGTGNRPGSDTNRESPARYDGTFADDFAEVRRRNEAIQEAASGPGGPGSGTGQAGVSEGSGEVPF